MCTIESTLDRVVNENASKDRFEAAEAPATALTTIAESKRHPAIAPITITESKRHPAIAPITITESKRHPAIAPTTTTESKRHPAIAPTTTTESKRHPATALATLADSRNASALTPATLPDPEKASPSFPTNPSNPEKPSASLRTNSSDPEKPSASLRTNPSNPGRPSASLQPNPSNPGKPSASLWTNSSDPEKRSTTAPEVFANPREASAIVPAVPGLSPESSGDAFEQAFRSLLPEMLALRRSQLLPINVDVPGAVTKALQIQPTLTMLMERILEVPLGADPRLPGHLTAHALALGHAHTLLMTASQGADALPSLIKEGKDLRAILLTDARALIRRGFIEAEAIRGLRANTGYRTLSVDLRILAHVLWPCLASNAVRTAVTAADLRRAQDLAVNILTLLGRREQLRADIKTAADLRRRAFTLFARVYDKVRRVAVYLRWQERDAGELVPSLHEKRKDRKKPVPANTMTEVQRS